MTRFRVDAPLGMGPDGPVHRARAERLGARPVAVRRLPVPAGHRRQRLRRDAETIASLGHPALAVVHDIVDLDDETVLVASTLGRHGTLADRLLLGPLPVDEAIATVRTAADALCSAHRLGLAHGRVSPSNLLLTDDGPVVCDLVQSAALHGIGPDHAAVAADATALVHLAATLVDAEDRSSRVAAYRSVCRWSAESCTDLTSFVSALDRLDHLESVDATAPVLDHPVLDHPVPAIDPRPRSDQAALGLVVGASLLVGAVLGIAGSVLPMVR